MIYRILADIVVVVHLAFVAFVVAGGALVVRCPRIAWVHLPCAVWGALISLCGWVCPLTPVETALRRAGHTRGYEGTFVEHYLLPLLYPGALTRPIQIGIGVSVVLVNVGMYGLALRRAGRGGTAGG